MKDTNGVQNLAILSMQGVGAQCVEKENRKGRSYAKSRAYFPAAHFPNEAKRSAIGRKRPLDSAKFHDLNDRFREKRTLQGCFRHAQNNAKYLSVQMTALPPEADIRLVLVKRSANDPKQWYGLLLPLTASRCQTGKRYHQQIGKEESP